MITKHLISVLQSKSYLSRDALNLGEDLSTIADFILVKDFDGVYRLANSNLSYCLGYKNLEEMIGLEANDFTMPNPASEIADQFIEEDKLVINTKKDLKIISMVKWADNNSIRTIFVNKRPIIDSNNNVLGTIGICNDVTNTNIGLALLLNKKNKKIQNSYQISNFNYGIGNKLTKKQSTCIFLMLRGKTAKEIADIMGISRRTVESHMQVIKYKLSCNSKSQIIDKSIELGFCNVIPEDVIPYLAAI